MKNIQNNVERLLMEFGGLKSLKHKKMLVWAYWREFDGLNEKMDYNLYTQLTDEESIVRARRKILEKNKEKDVISVAMAQKYKQYYLNN